jgi:hypothetical protein
MGSRAYSVVIDSVDAIKFLNAVGKHGDAAMPGYGIRNFIRITKDIKSKRKKSKDLKVGDVLANIAVRSEDPWNDYPNTYPELVGIEFNLWRLEWFTTIKSKLGGRDIACADYIEIPNKALLKNEDAIDGISRKWIESLINHNA